MLKVPGKSGPCDSLTEIIGGEETLRQGVLAPVNLRIRPNLSAYGLSAIGAMPTFYSR